MCKERENMPDSVRLWELRHSGAGIKLTDCKTDETIVVFINDIKYLKTSLLVDNQNEFCRKEMRVTNVYTIHGDFKVKESIEQISKYIEIVDAAE